MNIGKSIKQRRTERGLTQEELAAAVMVDRTLIAHIEAGRKIPNVLLFADIAKALRCTMDDLARYSA